MRVARLVPPGWYKVVCVGHQIITTKTDIRGMQLLLKIVRPSKMRNPSSGRLARVAGKAVQHVFWVTKLLLPYLARDTRVILGRRMKTLSQLTEPSRWLGKTCAVYVQDETYNSVVASRVQCFMTWRPKRRASGGAR